MYSLMIVEDELLARLALKNSISWEKYNIEEIIEARDGLEALEKYRKLQPDIMIVDINIPFMNGIELIREIRKEDAETKIIILSCLEDFNYAKEAIKANVSQYILKASMSMEEIESAVKGVTDEIKAENRKPLHRKQRGEDEENGRKCAALRKLLSEFHEEAENAGDVFSAPLYAAVFDVKFMIRDEKDLSQELLNKMNFVKNIIGITVREEFPCYVVTLSGELYAILIECKEASKKELPLTVLSVLQGAGRRIEKYTTAEVRIGISDFLPDQSLIYEGFMTAKRKLSYYCFQETGLTFSPEEEVLEKLEECCRKCGEEIKEELYSMGMEEVCPYAEEWPEFSEDYRQEMQNYWDRLMNRTVMLAEQKGMDNAAKQTGSLLQKVRETDRMEDGKELYLALLGMIRRESRSRITYPPLVEKALAYAQQNYGQPITLADAAEALHISSNYLSMIFSKEYGISYTDYLIRLRVEKAKILLGSGNEKLAEIAGKCGFNDHAYFTRTFKKYTKMSPLDYRKQSRGR